MRMRLWIGVGLACLLMGAGGTKTNLGFGPIAGRTWNGWVKQDSGELATLFLDMEPNGWTVLQSYADLVVTKDGRSIRYRGWADESKWRRGSNDNYLSFRIVGERDVAITPENREKEYRRDMKVLSEKSLGVFKLFYKINTDRKDPASAIVGTATGFFEGRIGLISFESPAPDTRR